MGKDNNDGDDYEVGYCKPPKSEQWPQGKSGNPKGRPKKVEKDPWEIFKDVLNKLVNIKNRDGSVSQITVMEAGFIQLTKKAANGDNASMRTVLSTLEKIAPVQANHQIPEIIFMQEDASVEDED